MPPPYGTAVPAVTDAAFEREVLRSGLPGRARSGGCGRSSQAWCDRFPS